MDRLLLKSIDTVFIFRFLKEGTFANILVIALLFSFGFCSSVIAQISSLQVGDRVRVTAPFVNPKDRIKGTVSEMSGSVLVLSYKDSLIYISNSLIQSLEVSTGKKRIIGGGFLIGAVTGTMVLGAISAIRNDRCVLGEKSCFLRKSNGDAFISGGTTGLVAGSVAGAVTGFFIKIDDWERTPVHIALGVASIPSNINEHSFEPNISIKIGFGE